jgi:hypothetical protein
LNVIEELESYYREVLTLVPLGPVGEADFTFDRKSLSELPTTLYTENLVVLVGPHEYNNSYRPDLISLILGRTTARSLGCLVLATLLHGPRSRVEIRHPKSQARSIVIECEQPSPTDPPPGLSLVPAAVRYYPEEESRHPWTDSMVDPFHLPWFEFTNEHRFATTEEQRASRDTVVVSGTPTGIARFGELLLNSGRPGAQEAEFDLEGEAGGFRSVAPSSAEARLLLPGSLHWSVLDLHLAE